MGLGEEEAGARDTDPEFELCYLDADGDEHRELPAAWPGLRPETFMPAREFRWARSQKHLPGLWWSVTTGSHVGYESWLERDHVMLLDFDPHVTAIAAQPFWLYWRDGVGRSRRHAPDLFARMADGSGIVIDVRPDDRIEEKDAEAFGVTRGACTLAGWGFRRRRQLWAPTRYPLCASASLGRRDSSRQAEQVVLGGGRVAGVFFAAREMQILVERHRHGRHPLKSWQS